MSDTRQRVSTNHNRWGDGILVASVYVAFPVKAYIGCGRTHGFLPFLAHLKWHFGSRNAIGAWDLCDHCRF